jgi:hypothetical protein
VVILYGDAKHIDTTKSNKTIIWATERWKPGKDWKCGTAMRGAFKLSLRPIPAARRCIRPRRQTHRAAPMRLHIWEAERRRADVKSVSGASNLLTHAADQQRCCRDRPLVPGFRDTADRATQAAAALRDGAFFAWPSRNAPIAAVTMAGCSKVEP